MERSAQAATPRKAAAKKGKKTASAPSEPPRIITVAVRRYPAATAKGSRLALCWFGIVADFPTVSAEQVRAVIALAATSAEEDLPVPGVPALE